jgi:hypothetical protein
MLKRITIYLNEMFPITAIIGSIISAIAIQLIYLRLFDLKPGLSLSLVFPGVVLTCVSLLIRIMDEFKDYQDDLINFPNRPLPSGSVKRGDLTALAGLCVLMIVFFSSSSLPLLIWSLITLAFTGLMFKWFFIEDIMRKSLPLAFLTHHPIVLFNFFYLLIACTQMGHEVSLEKWYLVAPVCLIYTNWELMRKIRTPAHENTYTTYSKIFGPRKAITIALILQTIFTLTVLNLFNLLGSPWPLKLVFICIQLVLSFSSLRFLFTLKLASPLRQNAEGQILLVVGFLLAAALI